MTAQFTESLIYNKKELRMCTLPFSNYLYLAGIDNPFKSNCSALWRGYTGTWEVLDGRLYLIKLYGHLQDGTEGNLETFFPEFPHRVFAHWYSGTLRIPQGDTIKYVHMGFQSIHESDFFIQIQKGIVIQKYIINNDK